MFTIISIIFISIFASWGLYAKPVHIFTCEPEWASLSQQLGGDKVTVFAATHAKQDPHYVRPRPQLITAMRQSDLIVCSGGGLEAGWLPAVLAKAGSRLQLGSQRYILASNHIALLDMPAVINRSQGDVHPFGNPHVHLDPYAILTLSDIIIDRLIAIDPDNTEVYQSNLIAFKQLWTRNISRWEAESVNKDPVIVHHNAFRYLLAWLNIPIVGTLEPQPGIPPNTRHLSRLLSTIDQYKPSAILRAPYDPPRASDWLSKKTTLPVVILPYTVGGDETSTDLTSLYDSMIQHLNTRD